MRRMAWPVLILMATAAAMVPAVLSADAPAGAEPMAVVTVARELVVFPVLLILLVAGMLAGRGSDRES
jgi:hypothetical protein